jgi:hypothetical protein
MNTSQLHPVAASGAGKQNAARDSQSGEGGGAMIVDKFNANQTCPVAIRYTGGAFDEEKNEKS